MRLPGEVFPFVIMDYFGYDGSKSSTKCDEDGRDGHCQNWKITWTLIIFTFYIPFICEMSEKVLMSKFKLRDFMQSKLIQEGI